MKQMVNEETKNNMGEYILSGNFKVLLPNRHLENHFGSIYSFPNGEFVFVPNIGVFQLDVTAWLADE